MALIAVKHEAEGQITRGGINKEALDRYIVRAHSYLPGLQGLRMTDAKGDILYGTGLTPRTITNIVDRDYFIFERDNIKGDIFISKPLLSRISNLWSIIIARRVNNPDGSFAGVVYGSLTINHFNDIFSGIDVGKKGSITLRDGELALIARFPKLDNTTGSKAVSKEFSTQYKAGIPFATFKAIAGIDNMARMITYRKIPDYPLVVVVALGEKEYLTGWRKELRAQTGLVTLFTIVTILSSQMLFVRWVREKKVEAELRTAKDDLELRVKQRTADLNHVNEQLKIELIERNEAEQKITDVTNYVQTILKTSPVGFCTYRATGATVSVNDAAARIAGTTAENLEKQNFRDLESWKRHGLFELAERALATGAEQRADIHYVSTFGKQTDLDCLFVPFLFGGEQHLLLAAMDITERKHMEEERQLFERQLLHTQKLESLGVLAGGIAHDFNNILMAIIGNAELALMRINKESPVVENLHKIEEAAARAADLAKQMLAYSGKGKFVVEHIDLNCLLNDMLHMLEVSISKKALLRLHLHTPLPSVEADATQIRQIIMNLVINASEAIGDKSGVIAITTGCMDCDHNYLKDVWLDENLSDGLYVYLEIVDTGCGMDRETMSKIFDPFFTTKFTGRGLGMAAVLGIVRGHKGAIKVHSEPRKGTTFKVLLPASNKPDEIFSHDSHADNWKGNGTVLLVDDEETVRGIGKEMLQELGFTTITANNGREAVELFKNTQDISFVILDLTMPHMDGEQCFRELRHLNPTVKVIMSSGYNEQEVTEKFVGKGLAGFVQKPYTLTALKKAIQQI